MSKYPIVFFLIAGYLIYSLFQLFTPNAFKLTVFFLAAWGLFSFFKKTNGSVRPYYNSWVSRKKKKGSQKNGHVPHHLFQNCAVIIGANTKSSHTYLIPHLPSLIPSDISDIESLHAFKRVTVLLEQQGMSIKILQPVSQKMLSNPVSHVDPFPQTYPVRFPSQFFNFN